MRDTLLRLDRRYAAQNAGTAGSQRTEKASIPRDAGTMLHHSTR